VTPVIVVAGPTGSGKSVLALSIAERHGGAVVNADSMQVYRELSVLTARPGPAELARAPHRLYGVVPASERCSAGRWCEMALDAVAEARGNGRLPVVVGGTGLYLEALTRGLAPIPPIPDPVRRAVQARIEHEGLAASHAALARDDPETARRIRPTDAQRIARAREVLEATGRPLADWQRDGDGNSGLRSFTILIDPPRAALYDACDARYSRMIAAGAVDEVRRLAALRLDPALPAMKALGVRELLAFLDGRATLPQACAAGRKATRNYAKRQMTWFRNRLAPDLTIESLVPPVPADALAAVDRFVAPP
jgi:tRNA dimethylallyltransferase